MVLAAAAIPGCGGEEPARTGDLDDPLPSDRATGAPTAEEVANATYSGLAVSAEVTLRNGEWEGEPFAQGGSARPRVVLAPGFLLAGDLDGDGTEESVVLLAESSGGSGTFDYVAICGRHGGRVENLGTAPLGDRVSVMRARVARRAIELDVVRAGPGDAMCCPSEKATLKFAFEGQALTETASEVTGKLALADLGGVEWFLEGFDWSDPAPAEPRITLTFDEARIHGSAGCNRYQGGVEAGDSPGDLRIDRRLATTRMACPDDIAALERRYLAALPDVFRFEFVATRLALQYRDGDAIRVLLFVAGPPA
jgi:heat shock protein HslJ